MRKCKVVNQTESTRPLSEQLLKDASGAVVDERGRYIGLIVKEEEHSHRLDDCVSFERALEQLKKYHVPVNQERSLRKYFWITVGAGSIAIILSQLIWNL
jgi:hypothetical protein